MKRQRMTNGIKAPDRVLRRGPPLKADMMRLKKGRARKKTQCPLKRPVRLLTINF